MVRVALVSLVSLLAVPAAADAALPPANPPAKSVAGVRISWPTATSLELGEPVTVTVRSSRRRARLSFVRVDANGTPVAAVARRTLRSGKFTVSTRRPGTYALRAEIAGRRFMSWIGVAPCFAARADQPGTSAAELRTAATTLALGGTLDYAIASTGTGCVTGGAAYGWQRQLPDGSWQALDLSTAFPLYATILGPGETFAKRAALPADAGPGTYRLVDSVTGNRGETITLATGAFAVTG